jgi:hypothetical protein
VEVFILLYQLLGGHLPYDEKAWLTPDQIEKAETLAHPEDRLFIDACIKKIIHTGKLLDLTSLPPMVDDMVVKIIRTATHKQPTKRFKSASEFLAKLSAAKQTVKDWRIQGSAIQLNAKTAYRVLGDGPYVVEKRKTGDWKKDHQFTDYSNLRTLIREIEQRPQS